MVEHKKWGGALAVDYRNTEWYLMADVESTLVLCPGLDEQCLEVGGDLCEQQDTMRMDTNCCRR